MIPCVAYMKLVYHNLKRGRTENYTDAFLKLHEIKVVPFNAEIAKNLSPLRC
jgi:hypothetical protein